MSARDHLRVRRIVGLILFVIVLLLVTAQWLPSGADATTGDSARQSPSATASAAAWEFEYFPSAYVNQAKQAEEPIQAF